MRPSMFLGGVLLVGLAACTSGPVRVPNDAIIYEVPPQGVASSRMPATQVPAASPFALPTVQTDAAARASPRSRPARPRRRWRACRR
jgi:hypothetical protein